MVVIAFVGIRVDEHDSVDDEGGGVLLDDNGVGVFTGGGGVGVLVAGGEFTGGGGGVLVADDGGEFTGGGFVFDAEVALSVSLSSFLRTSINFS